MHILDQIVATKKKEIALRREIIPISDFESSLLFNRSVISMSEQLIQPGSSGIIAEFKRRSPSKGWIHQGARVEEVVMGYSKANCAGISVLTDMSYFGGHVQDLIFARRYTNRPILRKEFIIDEYQILEARAIGADLILLIAEVLTRAEVNRLAAFAKSLGLEVLLEMHSDSELHKINQHLDIIGINNRDLKTFEVDLDSSIRLLHQIPEEFVRISESGLSEPESLSDLKQAGFQGFLIGETFMRSQQPGEACASFIQGIMDHAKVKA